MKKISVYLCLCVVAISIIACSDEPPSIRVKNERSTKANVQIKTQAYTINHNDISGGTASNYQDIPEGRVDVSAEIQNESVSPATSFNATENNNYTVVITNSNPPVLKVDVSEK